VSAPVYRAPMRARAIDVDRGAGAAFGLERGLVGIGDDQGAKAERMLRRFAELPDGTFVWTWTDDRFHLGKIDGPWRYMDDAQARAVGIHHVRPAVWLERPFGEDEAPAAVVETFARGGRNLQRIRSEAAERRTAELWNKHCLPQGLHRA
jgi:hypothetical protein